ncbi:MAG TPA: type II secretion system protein GspE, partial [Syntrophaceae bacterium]|nr:type II secretion system protein GspE [Syntrophaceae bacterium]
MTERLGNLLIRAGIITPDQLEQALQAQERDGGRLGSILLKLGFIEESTLTSFLSKQFGLPGIDLSKIEIPPSIIELIPAEIARRYQIIPLDRRGKTLTIAASDPSDTSSLDDIRFLTGYNIKVNIASEASIQKALDKYYPWVALSDPLEVFKEEKIENIEYVKDEEEDISLSGLKNAVQEAPVVRFVNATLMDAVRKHASDIHIESYEKVLRIRYRLDGVLHEIMNVHFPLRLKNAIISRLKIMAKLDIAERRLPQDGHIKLKLGGGHDVDLRVSVLPTIFGEKVVLRLADKSDLKLDMTKLGFEKEALAQFKEAIHKPYGMVLVTGPTGSGKSTTLYSALSELNQPGVNISTVEDPVEIDVPGINQVQTHEAIGLTFAAALRSFLRQDPDIIMVGEIRDFETVQIAVRAALTGHMVLSTLHTNDAPSTVTRLLDMG